MTPSGTVHKVTYKKYERVYVVLKRFAQVKTALAVLTTHTGSCYDNLVSLLDEPGKNGVKKINSATPATIDPLVDYRSIALYHDNLRTIFDEGTQKGKEMIESIHKEEDMVRTVDNYMYDFSMALNFCILKEGDHR